MPSTYRDLITLSWVKSENDFDEFEDHEDAFGAQFDEEFETGGDDEVRVGGHHIIRRQVQIRFNDLEHHLQVVRRKLDQRRNAAGKVGGGKGDRREWERRERERGGREIGRGREGRMKGNDVGKGRGGRGKEERGDGEGKGETGGGGWGKTCSL